MGGIECRKNRSDQKFVGGRRQDRNDNSLRVRINRRRWSIDLIKHSRDSYDPALSCQVLAEDQSANSIALMSQIEFVKRRSNFDLEVREFSLIFPRCFTMLFR